MKIYSAILNLVSIVSLICCLKQSFPGYAYLWFLPFAYLACWNFLIHPAINRNNLLTFQIANVTFFIRTVLMTFWLSLWPTRGFSGYEASVSLLEKGCLFIVYEVVFVSLFMFLTSFFLKRKENKQETASSQSFQTEIKEGNRVYWSVVFLTLSIIILIPSTRNLLHFFVLSAGTETRIGVVSRTFSENFFRQFIVMGVGTFVVAAALSYYNNFKKNKKIHKFLLYSAVTLCLGTIIGEQRSGQVYAVSACVFTLSRCFPKHTKKMVTYIIAVGFVILVFMTLYKSLYVFKYDSYGDAVSSNLFEQEKISENFEKYAFGPACVASVFSLEKAGIVPDSFSQFLYDFCRPVMGLNLLLKGANRYTTSELYNLYTTISGRDTSGLLIPISCHGYLFFGILASPILICIIYLITIALEFKIKTTSSLYTVFWMGYVFIRLSSCMVSSNIYTVLTAGSLVFWFATPIYLLQRMIDGSNSIPKTVQNSTP